MTGSTLRSRGFVYYDLWIVAAVLLVVGYLVASAVSRGITRRRRATALAYVLRIADFEHAHYQRTHTYRDSLPAALGDRNWDVGLLADSGGWTVWVKGPVGGFIRVGCGMFEGTPPVIPYWNQVGPGRTHCE